MVYSVVGIVGLSEQDRASFAEALRFLRVKYVAEFPSDTLIAFWPESRLPFETLLERFGLTWLNETEEEDEDQNEGHDRSQEN